MFRIFEMFSKLSKFAEQWIAVIEQFNLNQLHIAFKTFYIISKALFLFVQKNSIGFGCHFSISTHRLYHYHPQNPIPTTKTRQHEPESDETKRIVQSTVMREYLMKYDPTGGRVGGVRIHTDDARQVFHEQAQYNTPVIIRLMGMACQLAWIKCQTCVSPESISCPQRQKSLLQVDWICNPAWRGRGRSGTMGENWVFHFPQTTRRDLLPRARKSIQQEWKRLLNARVCHRELQVWL